MLVKSLHVEKECRNKSMDLHKQHGKQPGKNIKPKKGESNNTSHTKKK